MQVVESIQDAQVLDSAGRLAYTLVKDQRYVLFDHEAERGIHDGALTRVGDLDEVLPLYQGQRNESHRILVPFVGGQGDSLVLASCLSRFAEKYPHSSVDLTCPRVHHPLMELVDGAFEVLDYPILASELKHYSFYASLERISQYADDRNGYGHGPGLSNFQIFSRALQMPETTESVELKVSDEIRTRWNIGFANWLRIGICLGKSALVRSYPSRLVMELTESLLEAGAAAFFFGERSGLDLSLPHAPPMVCNVTDKTPTAESLVGLLSQMDAVFCCDTYFLHVAGALRLPTVSVFTASSALVAEGYPTVTTLVGSASCSPCGAIANTCPQKHNACIAHHDPALHPKRIAQEIMARAQSARTSRGIAIAD